MKFKHLFFLTFTTIFLLSGCSTGLVKQSISNHSGNTIEQSGDYQSLSNQNFKYGDKPYIEVNHNQSTLDPNTWSTEKIDYHQLDHLNRTGTATAYLSARNLGRSESRTEQTWQPTGWHNQPINVNGRRVFPQNRGHLIAYTITFNFNQDGHYSPGQLGSLNNPKNLATQTEFSNQKTMQVFEEKIRNALAQHKQVIYQVTPVFRGNELMPRGYWSQAISTDKQLNFNVYIWNIEPGVQFDYATGRGHPDQQMVVQILHDNDYQNHQGNSGLYHSNHRHKLRIQ